VAEYEFMEFKNFFVFSEALEDLLKDPFSLANMPRDMIQNLMQSKGGHGINDERIRWIFTNKFSWSVPCKEAIDAIKQFVRSPLRDLMSGTGFWAKILNQAGVLTIPYDLHKSKKYNPYRHAPTHISIKRQHALKTISDIKRRNLPGDILLSWPPSDCPVSYYVVNMLSIGSRIVYIGESSGGCTGDLALHNFFNNNCRELVKVRLPQFFGMHDYLWIYEKVKNNPIDPKLRGKSFIYDDDGDDEEISDF
jgi:hypothetical protein